MKIGLNREENKEKKLTSSESDKTVGDAPMSRTDHLVAQDDNSKMLTKKHDEEELAITLLIVGAELIAYHFW